MNSTKQDRIVAAAPERAAAPPWVALVVLVVIVIAAYSASLRFGFINYDDPHYITENPHVNTGLNSGNIKWAFSSTGETNLWSPLTFMSHQLDVSLFGLRPGPHHAVNVLWHALAAALLFLSALKLTRSTFWGFFVALIWAMHPEKVQSVAWLSERKDVLSGTMFFASLLAFAWWKRLPAKNAFLYGVSLFFFILALLAKPSVVPLPLVLFLFFYCDMKAFPASVRRAVRPLLPFFAAAALVAGMAIHFQFRGTLGDVGETFTLTQKASNIVVSGVFYLLRFFWPSPAQLWFSPPESVGPLTLSAAVLCVLVPLVIRLGRKDQLIIRGALTYVVLWLPVSGLVPVSYYFVADRYSYLPQVGLVFMLMGAVRLLTRSHRNLVPAGLALGLFSTFLIVLQQQQLPLWRDNETLFGHEMAINPDSLLAPIHYAEDLAESDPEKALFYYTKAHQNDPKAGIALAKMGMMQKRLGRHDEALGSFLKATEAAAPVRGSWTQLLVFQVELKLYDEAEGTIRRGIERNPDDWDFIMNSGNFHRLVRQQPHQALEYFLMAHHLSPGDVRSIRVCADSHRLLGNEDEARRFEAMLDKGR